jgi:hypothetical protein
MDEGSRIYLPRYNMPRHMATLPCHPGHEDVMPLCQTAQYRLPASRIGSIVISTETVGNLSSTAQNL